MPQSVLLLPLVALALGAAALGGGVYETVVVDLAWPGNPALIQPSRVGLNRARFWAPIHVLFEVALLASAWATWSEAMTLPWIVAALCAHFGARVCSFAYFIPNALRFEKMGDLSQEQLRTARRWVRLSRGRPVLELIAIVSLGGAILHLGAGRPMSPSALSRRRLHGCRKSEATSVSPSQCSYFSDAHPLTVTSSL